MGICQNKWLPLWGPHDKDHSILGSILRFPIWETIVLGYIKGLGFRVRGSVLGHIIMGYPCICVLSGYIGIIIMENPVVNEMETGIIG